MYHSSTATHYNPVNQPRLYHPPTPNSASYRAPYIPRTTMDSFGMPPSPTASSSFSSHDPNPIPTSVSNSHTAAYNTNNPTAGSSFYPSKSYMSPQITHQFDNLSTSTPGLMPLAGPSTNHRSINVLGWGPREGAQGTQVVIKADVDLPSTTPPPNSNGNSPNPSPQSKSTRALRVVFNSHPVHTAVSTLDQSDDSSNGQLYSLVATVPSFTTATTGYGNRVPVTVEVLSGEHAITASAPVGDFAYTNAASRGNPLKRGGDNLESARPSPHQVHRRVMSTNSATYSTPEIQQYATMPSTYHPSPSGRSVSDSVASWQQSPYTATGNSVQAAPHPAPPPYTPGLQPSLMRSTQLGPGIPAPAPYVNSGHKAALEMSGDLMTMSKGWTQEEWHARRRLVQFWRRQEGTTIHAAFKPISQAEYPAYQQSIIVSCIFREDKNACYVTSVDAIYLLEALVGTRFTVEEKNRIRRNLEGFRPITISKSKPGNEDFFRLIMNFPNPRPRNIEKDVKVFPWEILSQALKKIIGKYSASFPYPSSPMPPPPPPQSYPSSTNYGIPGPLQPMLPSPMPEDDYVKHDYSASISTGPPTGSTSAPNLTSHSSSDSSNYAHSAYPNPHTPSQHPNSPTAYRTSSNTATTPHGTDEKANSYLNLSPYGQPGGQWINSGDPHDTPNGSRSYVLPGNMVYPDQPHHLPHVHQTVSRQPNPNDLRINFPGLSG
ncbi:uncharacterized protein IL334_004223 [Kwoniella shivajii]|uniref:DUF7082 domain-containing protein n=1 Tax=Kwoniella shivajii TaxID=564305 RepID=A0ABZ1CZR6_9TREE|nr:hypothetical protein IL334_004223 [Kwoniella shivajii]